MNIDVHAHYIPMHGSTKLGPSEKPNLVEIVAESSQKKIAVNGKVLAPLTSNLIELTEQIADMKNTGIDYRLLAVPPFTFFYELDVRITKKWCQFINDCISLDIKKYPNYFGGLATLPMQNIKAAEEELERAVKVLGLKGAEIATNINGIELDDPMLDAFWDKAERLGAFILIHPHYVAGSSRMQDYYLRNLVGNPLDTVLAASRIIFGGVLERYPDLKICLSHGGGYLAFAVSRFEHGFEVRSELKHLKQAPSEFLKKFYYDTIVHDTDTLRFILQKVGYERILMGTDYPFDMGDLTPTESIKGLNLNECVERSILGNNASDLIHI
jgi:aminocarboxymuconate-semialdehyde decarboxylase